MRRRRLVLAVVCCSLPVMQLVRCGGGTATDDGGADVTTSDVKQDQTASDVQSSDVTTSDASPSCLPDAGVPGSLDSTFATGVKALGTFSPNAAAIDAQGRIYIAGTSGDCGVQAAAVVHRFNSDGTHDSTFGGADAAATGVCIHYDTVDTAYAVAIDANGAVVVGGLSYNGSTRIHATVTRLTSAGALDTTFNSTGMVDLNPANQADNGFAAVQGIAFYGNKIVVTGSTEAIRPGVGTRHTGLVERLNTDGSNDSGFAGGLYKDTNVVGYYGVVSDANGNVTTVGATNATPRQIVLRRLDTNGAPVGSFGDAGAFVTAVPTDGGTGPSEGRALVAAGSRFLVGGPMPATASGDYATGPAGVLAVSATGDLDTTFGGGVVTVPPMKFNIGYQLTALALECDGKILFGSRYDDPDAAVNANQDLGLSRLDSNGALDTTFGNGGVTHFPLAGNEVTVAVVQDPVTSKIVVVGGNQAGQTVLTRFNP